MESLVVQEISMFLRGIFKAFDSPVASKHVQHGNGIHEPNRPTVQTQFKHANRKLNIDSSDKAVQRMRHLDAGAGQRIDEVFK
ncbi:MAG: hypothetical protein CFE41_16070 [Burkholderiales bacterium PBB2]|nr:MAG: hypothetical protein CFE41_16070 [Burkholderiales bacterium PBB2]